MHRRLGPESKPMSPEHRDAVRAAQSLRIASRRLLALMSEEEAATYRLVRTRYRGTMREALDAAGRSDLAEANP